MTIGQRIKDFRSKKGYKVKELADIIGVSQGTLSDIENGKTRPSADTIAALVRNTDINPSWLLTGEGRIESPTEACLPEAAPLPSGHTKVREASLEYIFDIIKGHNSKILNKMIEQLARIMEEGDYRKLSSIQSLLAVLDPKKEEG